MPAEPTSQPRGATLGIGRVDIAALGPGVIAFAALVLLAVKDGGYSATAWYLAALYLLALLVVVTVGSRGRILRLSRPATAAVAFMAAFTAWSFASIWWAGVKGDAWDGANRTLLYLIVFTLFAALPWRTVSGVAILMVFVLATTALGLVVFVRAGVVGNPQPYFIGTRFSSPTGYQNANAALFMTPVWPALFLAARREVAPLVRGVMLASAAFLVELAILGQSRGWLYATPVVILLYLAVVPRRVRSLFALGVVGAATALAWQKVSDVFDAVGPAHLRSAMRDTWPTLGISCAVLFAIGLVWGLTDRRIRLSANVEAWTGRVVGTACVVAAALLLTFSFTTWHASHRIHRAWHQFTSEHPKTGVSSHFSSGLGGGRYDFWRVALAEFKARPIGGVGADNFALGYLEKRKTTEEPLYPHSVELRILAGTGAVGGALFLGFLLSALAGAASVWRSRAHDALGKGVVAAAVVTFGYWWIHGSVDWFWEFPGLGGAAFAWLGLAAGLARAPAGDARERTARPWVRRVAVVAGAAVTVFAIASFVPPWLSAREVATATDTWRADPGAAFDRLSRARTLNFLSDRPNLVAGAIASRVRDWPRMRRNFEEALDRNPRNWYPYLELGVLDSIQGRDREALKLLAHARKLDPLEETTTEAIARIRKGHPVTFEQLDRVFVERVKRRLQ